MIYRDHLPLLDCLINKKFIKLFGKPILPNTDLTGKKDSKYNFFTKGLKHNANGDLTNENDYLKMMKYIILNDKKKFSKIGMLGKMVDPFSSNSAVINGVMQGVLKIIPPPHINSVQSSNEMIELYAQSVCRDTPFINYETDETIKIAKLVLEKDTNNIFRTVFPDTHVGPYVSQFLLLNIDFDTYKIVQKYTMYLPKKECIKLGIRNEWGVTLEEAVNIQNIQLNKNPPGYPDKFLIEKYINDGRSLARAVHKDTPYQYFYNAYMILSKLKIPYNPTWPQFDNNNYFLMGNGVVSSLCSIAEITKLALFHAWYWKWQQYRKLRPEEYAIMINNVKATGINSYGINEKVLNNIFTDMIENYNYEWTGVHNQYVMPLTYQEGSPLHPAYPSGHAVISGACCTILKMMFDASVIWTNYSDIYQASATGEILEVYNGPDKNSTTVQVEIDKLASNIAYGRNWAGIHYASDANEGIRLGEKVAVQYMRDLLSRNNFDTTIKFKGFDGEIIDVSPIVKN